MASTPLVALAGNAVTTWDSLRAGKDDAASVHTFHPQGSLPLADVAWNHNGQGKFLLRFQLFEHPVLIFLVNSFQFLHPVLPSQRMSNSTTMSS